MSTGEFLLYTTEDGVAKLEVRLVEETVWLNQKQMADLFQKDVRTISEHIRNVFGEGELAADSTVRNFRTVRTEGQRYQPGGTALRGGVERAEGVGTCATEVGQGAEKKMMSSKCRQKTHIKELGV